MTQGNPPSGKGAWLSQARFLGLPNPAAYYTLELQPLLLERFHQWHVRMGMERSPLDHCRCC